MTPDLRVLIVGGYGVFGGRLVELLQSDTRLTLLVAGRSLKLAREYCAARSKALATLVPTMFDRTNRDPGPLVALHPTIVVDASGPFQAYGRDGYSLVEHCIAHGIHYLDLADGSDFVAGIAQFDARARDAGVYVLSGVSSFPVLTAAVVRRLAVGVAQVQSIRGGIAPSPYAAVGLNVIRAIAGYSGQRIRVRRLGRASAAYPFTESMRFVIAVPGMVPLARTRFSLVDVPDLRALTELWPQADVWMGAGPVPVALHRALIAFAWLVRLRLLRSLSGIACAMHLVANHVRWGEHRGGMFVSLHGLDSDGKPIVREWHLLAEGDDGPLIPCMAVEAVIKSALAGHAPPPGARSAASDVDLSQYEQLFAQKTIYSGVRQRLSVPETPLYQRILGTAWDQLHPAIRQLHSVTRRSSFVGRCTVERGSNPIAFVIAALIGFPKTGADQAISVQLTADRGGERWVRFTGDQSFESVQSAGVGRSEWLVRERFGPVAVDMALVVERACLRYVVRRWSFFGISLPLWLGPRSAALEDVHGEQFRFDVEVSLPIVGLIVRYSGMLAESAGHIA